MAALDLTADWPVPTVAAAALSAGDTVATIGDVDRSFRLASITKPIVAWAVLVAIEEGVLALDQPAGQPGCTVRHLLAHAGGYPFEGAEPIAPPERSRIYSNAGFEILGATLEQATGMDVATYVGEAVLHPLGMTATTLRGSPAHGASGSVRDLTAFVHETGSPTLVHTSTRDDAVRPHYPALGGIVPGVGRYETCPWGLGFEIRGDKQPHWTGLRNSPGTYGHFGGAGTMMWSDPSADVALIALTDRPFDTWALEVWPALSDAVLEEYAGTQ